MSEKKVVRMGEHERADRAQAMLDMLEEIPRPANPHPKDKGAFASFDIRDAYVLAAALRLYVVVTWPEGKPKPLMYLE